MAIVISPLYPVAGETVTLSLDNDTGNETGYYIDNSPARSDIEAGFLGTRISSGSRVGDDEDDTSGLTEFDSTKFQEMIDAGVLSSTFVPDAAGEYEFVAHEVRKVTGIPSYPGDPSGAIVQEVILTQSTSIYVGEYVDLPIVTAAGDGADLRLQINNSTVRAATLENHRSDRSVVAAKQAAVLAALNACVGITAAAIGTDLATGANDLLTEYELHRAIGGAGIVHVLADATNVATISAATSPEGALLLLNHLRTIVVSHTQTSTAAGGGAWHTVDDLINTPLAAAAVDVSTATVLSADLRERVYERHRVQIAAPATHLTADAGSALAAPSVMDNVITAFLDALVLDGNTAQDNENQGEVDLRAKYGFTLSSDTTSSLLSSTGSTGTGGGGTGLGDVVGPAGATALAVARFDGVTGKLLQNSTTTLTDAGGLLIPTGGYVTIGATAAPTGDVRLGDTGTINFYGTGPADIAGLSKDAADLVTVGGANPTRPSAVAIDPVGTTTVYTDATARFAVSTTLVTAMLPIEVNNATGNVAGTGDLRCVDAVSMRAWGTGPLDIGMLTKNADDLLTVGGPFTTRPTNIAIDATTSTAIQVAGTPVLTAAAGLVTSAQALAVGAAPYAPTGTVRLPDAGAINFWGTGPADISGLFKDGADLLTLGGANPTRPANIAIDATTSTAIQVAGAPVLTAAAALVTSAVDVAIGAAPSATGAIRLEDAASIRYWGTGPLAIGGLTKDAADLLTVGGPFTTRPTNIAIDATTSTAIQVAGTPEVTIASGLTTTAGKLGIGTATVPHGGVGAALLAIDAPSASDAGPHQQFTLSDVDNYPTMQLWNHSRDNCGMILDAYWTAAGWRSSNVDSNFRVVKNANKLELGYDSGIAQGAQVIWNQGLTLGVAGLVTIPTQANIAKLGVGTATVPHGGVGLAMMALDGGTPFIQFTTTADDYPLMQILPLQHDSVVITFDAYYDGAWKSSDVGSNFAIVKSSADALEFRYDSAIAQGNVLTWNTGLTLNTSGLVAVSTAVSVGASAATLGEFRLPNNGQGIKFRNAANTADINAFAMSNFDQIYVGDGNNLNVILLASASITVNTPFVLQSYAKASLPAVTAASIIYVTDEAGGAVLCFADGANWRRCTDRAVVS